MIALVLVLIVFHQSWVLLKTKRFDPFSIYTLIDAVIFMILVVGTMSTESVMKLVDQDFGFAAMLPAGQIALYAGLHLLAPKPSDKTPRFNTPSLFWLYLSCALYLGIAVAIAAVYMRIADMSFADWMFGQRSSAYALGRSMGFGALLNNFFMAAQVGVLILLTVALKQKRYVAAAIVYGVLFLGMFLIFTTRFQLLIILLLPIIVWHYNVKRMTFVSFAAMLVFFVASAAFLNLWRGGGVSVATEEVDMSNVLELSSIGKGTYFIEPAAKLYEGFRNGELEYEYGANYGYLFVTFVPRYFWKEKPLTAFENRMTVNMFGSELNSSGLAEVWTFTAWGEGLAQFDVFGVILNLLLYGMVVAAAFRYCCKRPELFLVWVYYSFLAAVYLRAGFTSLFILTINMIVVAVIFEALPRVKFLTKREGSHDAT